MLGGGEEGLLVGRHVELVGQRHVVDERHERRVGEARAAAQLRLLVRLQRAQQVELVGEEGAVGDVVDQLVALAERVPVDAARALHPLQSVLVAARLEDLLPAQLFHHAYDPGRKKEMGIGLLIAVFLYTRTQYSMK